MRLMQIRIIRVAILTAALAGGVMMGTAELPNGRSND